MDTEKNVQEDVEKELEVSKNEEAESDSGEKTKKDLRFEFALILILGFLLGFTLKTEAIKRVTMGFGDYLIGTSRQSYDFAGIQKELEKQAQEAQQQQNTDQGTDQGMSPQTDQGTDAGSNQDTAQGTPQQ